jgi:hypothetical protein
MRVGEKSLVHELDILGCMSLKDGGWSSTSYFFIGFVCHNEQTELGDGPV